MNKIERKIKEIPLNSIVKVVQSGMDATENHNSIKYLFLIKTDEEVYYCGNGNESEDSPMNTLARQFYNIFKMVYLPYSNLSIN